MNGLCVKVQPGLCSNAEVEEETVTHNVVELASEAALESVHEDDDEELFAVPWRESYK
jgi:hypothetical protein